MMVSKFSSKLGVLALALGMGAGCSFTTMETARQLEGGEAVLGGALDWPGFLYIPRVSAYGKVGLADRADLGLQGGFSFATANLGATVRAYPTDWLTMSLQTEGVFVINDFDALFGASENSAALLVLTPRISTAVNEGDFLYGGVQSNILNGWEYIGNSNETQFGFQGAVIGAFAGVEVDVTPGLSMQTELMVLPVSVDNEGVNVFFSDGGLTLFQFSVGLNYRFGGEPEAVRLIEPSEEPVPERPVREQPTPEREAEPEREPEYDDGGVPIY